MRLQTQPRPPKYSGALDCFRQTLAYEGVRGLFRGVSMPLLGATIENASLFFTYNQVQDAIRRARGLKENAPLPMHSLAIAAACAGAVTGFVLTPLELVKCKMQVQMMHKLQPVPPHTLVARVLRQDGVRGLWLGLMGTLLRETGGGVAWFLTFEACTQQCVALHRHTQPHYTRADLGSLELMASGALAGMAYNVSMFPADSVKSTMQTERDAPHSAAARPLGFWGTFARIYATRGLSGLYAGVGVTCLRSAPSSGLVFLIYNKLEQYAEQHGW